MLNKLDKKINELKGDLIDSTREMVQIKSVESKGKENMPFGEGVNEALERFLEIAGSLGLRTNNLEGYAGYAEIGEGDEMLGILCHLDVVPEGSNWTYPPYGGEIHDNKIYGRGIIDDKGPAVAALYALKAVKDCGISLNKRVRVIVGTDEESGWEGLNYYLANDESPDFAFSPDAEFPVIHAEKGILTFKLKMDFQQLDEKDQFKIKSIKGGNAPNMVPDYCEALIETNEEIQRIFKEAIEQTDLKLELTQKDGEIILKSHGVSAHGSLPQDGINAISQLVVFLNNLALPDDDLKDFIANYTEKIGMEYNGESIGCDFSDDVSGRLTLNVGMIELSREEVEVVINIRYPVTCKDNDVYQGIREEIKDTSLILEEGRNMDPLYVPKDDPLVRKLMKVYQEITGDKSEPISIGGGTYARAVEKAVAFGPLFPGQPELAHQKDEFIAIDDLIKNAKIYAQAIVELGAE